METGLVVNAQVMFVRAHPGGTFSLKMLKWSMLLMSNVLHWPSFNVNGVTGPLPPFCQVKGKFNPPDGLVFLQMVMVCAPSALNATRTKARASSTGLRIR